jgi:hypothetical protein
VSSRPIASVAVIGYLGLHSLTLYSSFDLFVVLIVAAFTLGLIVRRWWASFIPFVPLVPAPLVLALSANDPSAELDDVGVFILASGLSVFAALAAGLGFGAADALRPKES